MYLEIGNFMTWVDPIIGITAIISLWFSIKALRKSEWDSAMNTAPGLVVRPSDIWTGIRKDRTYMAYTSIARGEIIYPDQGTSEIAFTIILECFNAGRGVAFNILPPKSEGMPISEDRTKIALYQTLTDSPFEIGIQLIKTFDEWYAIADKKIPVDLEIIYTNDQGNVHCRSNWSANIQPFNKKDDNLEARELCIINSKGRIQYLDKPFTGEQRSNKILFQIVYEK